MVVMILRCRHLVFAEYFGDAKPKCENRCDVCSDRKSVERQLNDFAMNVTKFNSQPKSADALRAEADDLYGGGRGIQNR